MKSLDEKLSLIREVGEEIVIEEELKELLKEEENLVAYDGFEPSGQIHIAQGLMRAININKMIEAGFTFKMLVADWHAMANLKFGGDLEKIQTAGKYFIEVWKACGLNMDKVEFVWANDLVKKSEYWQLVLKIASLNTVQRVIRCAEIMGRQESLELSASQIIYPCMQVADIFMLGAKVAQLGMDQRKVNMLARKVGPQLGYWKPISVSHHMLMGLGKPANTEGKDAVERTIALKMSKSNPNSCVFMTDDVESVQKKIKAAWCPEGEIKENPVLEYMKYIVFEKFEKVEIKRKQEHGGDVVYKNYADLEKDFAEKKLHPVDLKNLLADKLNELLEPAREHFAKSKKAKELLEKVKSYQK